MLDAKEATYANNGRSPLQVMEPRNGSRNIAVSK